MRVTRKRQAMELKKFRKIAGLSQEALAAKSGVDIAVISRLERGLRRQPSYETVVRLARALNLEPEELIPVAVGRKGAA
jgi:transcriptional regulator with XRE-family HTH domain